MEALHRKINSPFYDQFTADVIQGLSQADKQLPAKYFYDNQGSRLFDGICELPEYYPYRTELGLLPGIAKEMNDLLQPPCEIIEFGAGSLIKIRVLLQQIKHVKRFVPIDIAGEHLRKASQLLRREFRSLIVHPIEADFTQPVDLPQHSAIPRLGFFPGSTIGNFLPEEAIQFLANARTTLGKNSLLLIGVDSKKDPLILHHAYNDYQGITAEFNRNILVRINREIGADFDVESFHHYAFYNAPKGRVEMHLVSGKDQKVTVAGIPFRFMEGETIHTENSHKYTTAEFRSLSEKAGWSLINTWHDEKERFRIHLMQVT